MDVKVMSESEFCWKYRSDNPKATYGEAKEAYQDYIKAHVIGTQGRLGGMGGTMYQGDEQGHGYEGVNLSDPTICKRIPTITKLLDHLTEKRVLLIRSPPMAGKTSLAQLLENYLLEEHTGMRVFRVSLLWMQDDNPEWTFSDRFQWLMGGVGWRRFVSESSGIETILIVDEVQKLYKPDTEDSVPLHGGKEFWDAFKDVQQYSKLRIVAFASYGYCGAYDANLRKGTVMNVSPFQLSEHNTWGLENMRFMSEEFTEYVGRFCEQKLKSLSAPDKNNLLSYIRKTTSCHPGLVAFAMDRIYERFSAQIKQNIDPLTFEKIYKYLKSYDFYASLMNTRAVYGLNGMTDDEQMLTDCVLFSPSGINIRPEAIPNKGRLIKTNILSDVSDATSHQSATHKVLDFAAPLIRLAYLQNRVGSMRRSVITPKTFREFLTLVFAGMNPKTLQVSLGIGVDGRLLERVWQMEFYCAATQVLPANIFISVDVGAVFGSSGFIDFYVDDARDWAIELLRDGNDVEEHCRRFEADNVYGPIVKIAKEYAIIDIRQSQKELPRSPTREFIHVQCAKNFEFVIMRFADGSNKKVALLGSGIMEVLDAEKILKLNSNSEI